jgi:ribosomal subunit interface protein
MKVSYRGIEKQLPSKLQEKLDAKFAKLSKMIEKRGEKEAHVVITTERHLHKAEVTVQFYDHPLVGIGSDGDLFTAMAAALDKLEKQAVKQRTKWLDHKRSAGDSENAEEESEPAPAEKPSTPQVFRVNHFDRRKPMTLEEALMEMEDGRDYLVYRDADKECVSVLVRRRDGNFDLIES